MKRQKRASGDGTAPTLPDWQRIGGPLFAAMQDGVILRDAAGTLREVSPSFCAMTGFSREQLVGSTPPYPFWPEEHRPAIEAAFARYLAGEAIDDDLIFQRADGERFPVIVSAAPIRAGDGSVGGYVATIKDVTERARGRDAGRFLADASALLAESLDYQTTLARVAQLAVPFLADWCIVDVADETARRRRVAVAHADPAEQATAEAMLRVTPPDTGMGAAVGAAIRGGRSILRAEIGEAAIDAYARDADHRRLLAVLGPRSMIVVPMRARERTLGAITLLAGASGRRYGPADLRLAEELAARAAVAVDNARLYGEARAAERAQHEARALLDTILSTAPVGLGFWDRELRFVQVNDALAAINGLPAAAHAGRTLGELLPDGAPATSADLRAVLATGEPIINREVSGVIPGAPGQPRHWLANYYPVKTAAGEIVGIGGVVNDITGRKRIEDAVRFLAQASQILGGSLDYEVTLAAVAELTVPGVADWCAIYLLDADDALRPVAIAHSDPAQVALFEEVVRRYQPDQGDQRLLMRVLRTGQPLLVPEITAAMIEATTVDAEQRRLFAQLGLCSTLAVPLHARGRTIGVLTFGMAESARRMDQGYLTLATDLARRIGLAVDNARLYDEAQAAVRARDEFLAIASHELKTPLTPLQIHIQSLLRSAGQGKLSTLPVERVVRDLEAAQRQSKRLARLIEDLLDLSRLTAGRLALHLEPVDLAVVVRELCEQSREALAAAGCALTLSLDEALVGNWDRLRVGQIAENLLSNAIKYAPGAPVAVTARRDGDHAVLVVADRGIGIAPEAVGRIFGRFERAVPAREYSGLGLGLYIVRQIVEALGGTIDVASAPEAGSTFIVRLPLAGPAEAAG